MADFGNVVLDGAAVPEHFRGARPRVLWLLRDVNDPGGQITDVRIGLREFANSGRIAWKQTYGAVARVSYALLHPDEPWDHWCEREEVFASALGDIAVVNVKKTAGDSTVAWHELESAFTANEAQLREQFENLDPQIVIGGNVLWLFRHWLKWEPSFSEGEEDPYPARLVGSAIWVHAHHPNHRGSHRRYCDRIVAGIERATAAR